MVNYHKIYSTVLIFASVFVFSFTKIVDLRAEEPVSPPSNPAKDQGINIDVVGGANIKMQPTTLDPPSFSSLNPEFAKAHPTFTAGITTDMHFHDSANARKYDVEGKLLLNFNRIKPFVAKEFFANARADIGMWLFNHASDEAQAMAGKSSLGLSPRLRLEKTHDTLSFGPALKGAWLIDEDQIWFVALGIAIDALDVQLSNNDPAHWFINPKAVAQLKIQSLFDILDLGAGVEGGPALHVADTGTSVDASALTQKITFTQKGQKMTYYVSANTYLRIRFLSKLYATVLGDLVYHNLNLEQTTSTATAAPAIKQFSVQSLNVNALAGVGVSF